jgi:hypothetical protein
MNDQSKVQLSSLEMELVKNSNWILTKNAIQQKVKKILEELQWRQQQYIQSISSLLPPEVMAIPPKISKGENYMGLPYMILDYPRFFDKEDQFAIRSMFWWGNFFSVTLHLSGISKQKHVNKIESYFELLKENEFFISVNDDPWVHHFEGNNYRLVNEIKYDEFKKNLFSKDFIKLAKKFPLEQWDDAGDKLFGSFCAMIRWLVN